MKFDVARLIGSDYYSEKKKEFLQSWNSVTFYGPVPTLCESQ